MELNRYRGDGLPLDAKGKPFPYRASPKLAKAVNMAIALQKPLLVKGPPGCGKTRLAKSIAHELGLLQAARYYEWHVKSTSRARDGLYTIDVVRRLHDSHIDSDRAQRLTNYIHFGGLGEAIRQNAESVLLIDEIDKADLDFPNDLLREIDEKKFTVEEISQDADLDKTERAKGFRRTYESKKPPIIIITSNDEKELPDAFLRRCLFYYIEFPRKEELIEIVRVNTPDLKGLPSQLIERAVDRLDELRALEGFRKEPATGELIDWVRILYHWGIKPNALKQGKPLTELPYWEMLFKHQEDTKTVEQHHKGSTALAR